MLSASDVAMQAMHRNEADRPLLATESNVAFRQRVTCQRMLTVVDYSVNALRSSTRAVSSGTFATEPESEPVLGASTQAKQGAFSKLAHDAPVFVKHAMQPPAAVFDLSSAEFDNDAIADGGGRPQ